MIKVISFAAMIFLSGTLYAYGAMESSAEWDQSVDFSRLKTYAWLPEPSERMHDSRVKYMLIEPRVKSSADIDLRHKGYKKVEAETADFLIGYQVVVDSGWPPQDWSDALRQQIAPWLPYCDALLLNEVETLGMANGKTLDESAAHLLAQTLIQEL